MVERPGQPNIGLLKSSSVDCLERDIKNSGYRKEDLAAPSIPELIEPAKVIVPVSANAVLLARPKAMARRVFFIF